MEGCTDRKTNKNDHMDSKGAQELARLIEARLGDLPEPEPVASAVDESAAPIFHWFGIDPAEPPPENGP